MGGKNWKIKTPLIYPIIRRSNLINRVKHALFEYFYLCKNLDCNSKLYQGIH